MQKEPREIYKQELKKLDKSEMPPQKIDKTAWDTCRRD